MPTANDFRTIFVYNERVLQAYFNALAQLSWETLSKNVEASHYSMKNIFVHILTVYNGLINYTATGKADMIPWEEHDYDNYHSMEQIQEFMSNVMRGVRSFIEELDDSKLAWKAKPPWMQEGHDVNDILMQVTLEQAHHIGELIALLWQMNIEPPAMTWIDYRQ